MKRSDILKVVMNSNVLVVYAAVVSMIFSYISEKYYMLRGINTVLLVMFAVLFAVYVEWRILYKKQRIAVLLSAMMIVLETLLVHMKYNFFIECETAARNIWYAYYVPYILIPLFILYASMYVGKENKKARIKAMAVTSFVSLALIIFIMTNDLHQWMFRFRDNFANWDSDYSYGFLFYIVYAWIVILFVNAFTNLLKKSNITIGRKYSWQVLLYVGFAWFLTAIDGLTDIQRYIFGTRLIGNPILFCAMSISFILTCIRLWLIPAEIDYYELNNAIEEINEQLKEESEVIRLRNELKTEQTALTEKNAIYDEIAQSVSAQSKKILNLTDSAENLPLICFYGVYIKRLSNLELIAFDNEEMNVYELLLSVRESAQYLNIAGIPTNLTGYTERFMKSEIIVEAYKYLQYVIENNLERLQGMYVTFPKDGNIIMRTVFDGICIDENRIDLCDNLTCSAFSEDGVSYLSFVTGGEEA